LSTTNPAQVFFIGAGPGAKDLITIRGKEIVERVSLILYAGSLVPLAVLEYAQPGATIVDTSPLNLDEQINYFKDAHAKGMQIARIHSGDPAIYGATAEQMRRLNELGIPYEIVPGVSSFTAAAAILGTELTKPSVSQTIIITRVSGRASQVPELEDLKRLAAHNATMAIFLSGPQLESIVAQLLEHYAPQTPVALVYRATWPEEKTHESTLGRILEETDGSQWKLTTMMLVGNVLDKEQGTDSKLYSADYSHRFRKANAGVNA
jgi:precorrin-4/cobalt-precorrin-4 C11-methyltransferase